ncbi:MAG: DUF58 domain-containing protein [Oscillospiraceae bacterium]|nr:DUF58 domain-containing protein [Oscillospiraceae bacterium]
MIFYRFIYIVALVASFFFFIFYPPWLSWYLFVLIALLLPLDFFLSLPGMLTKSIYMSVPPVLEVNDNAHLTLTTLSNKPFPVRCIVVKLQISGDGFSVGRKYICGAGRGSVKTVSIDTSHSGVTVFSLKRISVVSLLGLFSVPVKNLYSRQLSLVLPPAAKPANTMALQKGTHLRPKPGGGFSEEHDMREYRHGDPVRSIHWKISAKHDSLYIREPLELPPHSRLVHIMPWKNSNECDLILGNLRWVAEHLLKWNMPFYLRFGDVPAIAEITHESDIVDFLFNVLGGTAEVVKKPDGLPTRFSWVFRVDAGGGSL